MMIVIASTTIRQFVGIFVKSLLNKQSESLKTARIVTKIAKNRPAVVSGHRYRVFKHQ